MFVHGGLPVSTTNVFLNSNMSEFDPRRGGAVFSNNFESQKNLNKGRVQNQIVEFFIKHLTPHPPRWEKMIFEP